MREAIDSVHMETICLRFSGKEILCPVYPYVQSSRLAMCPKFWLRKYGHHGFHTHLLQNPSNGRSDMRSHGCCGRALLTESEASETTLG